MSQTDKVEVMDFLINVLKDHEKNLDSLITRAEELLIESQKENNLAKNQQKLKISIKYWEDFCECTPYAELVCFDLIDSIFYCDIITDKKIYQYNEKAHTQYILNTLDTINWLSKELGIHRDFIIQGNITH
jgi:hypothetical protein